MQRMPAIIGQNNPAEPEHDTRLIAALQHGLQLVPRPYAALAREVGMSEDEVITRLRRMLEDGTLKRLGVVVRHHELGYRANAMLVWDVPDDQATQFAHRILQCDFVTLCYRRVRHLPQWPYNLYCMIHGRDRRTVEEKAELLIQRCGLREFPHAVLFSSRRFKQHGARYRSGEQNDAQAPTPCIKGR
jgi:DNA-binding Lrp family transcriptional regulator